MTSNSTGAIQGTTKDRELWQPEKPMAPPAGVVRMGVIGYGYWGPNIVRNLHGLDNCHVAAVCDKSPTALGRARRLYPSLHLTTDFMEILTSPDIDAVAVVTSD